MQCIICNALLTRETGVPLDDQIIVCANMECSLAYFEQSRTRYVWTCHHCHNEYEKTGPNSIKPMEHHAQLYCPSCMIPSLSSSANH